MSVVAAVHIHTSEDPFTMRVDGSVHEVASDNVELLIVLAVEDSYHDIVDVEPWTLKRINSGTDIIAQIPDNIGLDIPIVPLDSYIYNRTTPPWGEAAFSLYSAYQEIHSDNLGTFDISVYGVPPADCYHVVTDNLATHTELSFSSTLFLYDSVIAVEQVGVHTSTIADTAILSDVLTATYYDGVSAHEAIISDTLSLIGDSLYTEHNIPEVSSDSDVLGIIDSLVAVVSHPDEELGVIPVYELEVHYTHHKHFVDEPSVFQAVAINDTYHAHTASEPEVASRPILDSHSATHRQYADTVFAGTYISVLSSSHVQASDTLPYIWAGIIPAAADHLHDAEQPTVSPLYNPLSVARADHLQTVDDGIGIKTLLFPVQPTDGLVLNDTIVVETNNIFIVEDSDNAGLSDSVAATYDDGLGAHEAIVVDGLGLSDHTLAHTVISRAVSVVDHIGFVDYGPSLPIIKHYADLDDSISIEGYISSELTEIPSVRVWDSLHLQYVGEPELIALEVIQVEGDLELSTLEMHIGIDNVRGSLVIPGLDIEASITMYRQLTGTLLLPSMGLEVAVLVGRTATGSITLSPLTVDAEISVAMGLAGSLTLSSISMDAYVGQSATLAGELILPSLGISATVEIEGTVSTGEYLLTNKRRDENWESFVYP